MKKIWHAAALTVALMGTAFGLAWSNEAAGVEAYYQYGSTPVYLDNNPDYVEAYQQMGDDYFVDVSSTVIVKQENQFYEIAANMIQYRPTTGEILNTYTKYILFDTKRGYVYKINNGKIDFQYPIYTHAHTSENGLRTLAIARLMWHKATGKYWNH